MPSQYNVPMAPLSSMKTGGIAPEACFPETEEELVATVRALKAEKRPFYVLGNLSNVLLPDGEIPFVPVVTTQMRGLTVTETREGALVYASCGLGLTKLALDMCRAGYSGLSFAYGIPGTVGGAVYMNAGAYGSEMSAVVRTVRFYDSECDQICELEGAACAFGYRSSVFQQKNGVILGASLALPHDEEATALENAKEFMRRRKEKQPLEFPSCGSAFKRPEGHFAGELIETCGLKGFSVGGAQVSEKHAGFVINAGGATSAEVEALLMEVKKRVFERFGVLLEPEIRILK